MDANQDRYVSKQERETYNIVTAASAFWAAPGAYLYNLSSDPYKVETIVETSIDVFSPGGGPLSTTSIVADAESIVLKEYGEYLLKNYSKKTVRKNYHRLSALKNKKTGYTYMGKAGGIKSLDDPSIHPELKKRLSKKQLESWNQANCAKCDATNQALWDGAEWDDLSNPIIQSKSF